MKEEIVLYCVLWLGKKLVNRNRHKNNGNDEISKLHATFIMDILNTLKDLKEHMNIIRIEMEGIK